MLCASDEPEIPPPTMTQSTAVDSDSDLESSDCDACWSDFDNDHFLDEKEVVNGVVGLKNAFVFVTLKCNCAVMTAKANGVNCSFIFFKILL